MDNTSSTLDKDSSLSKYHVSLSKLHEIRRFFIAEMQLGLSEQKEFSDKNKIPSVGDLESMKSRLKMLPSHVKNIPNGSECGRYYTLDWGGTNYRVLRIDFLGRKNGSVSHQIKERITDEYMHAKNEKKLFNHLADILKTFVNENEKNGGNDTGINISGKYPVGFCFSFPMWQPRLDSGILLQWTKGFTVPNVVGRNVTQLMRDGFKRVGINNVVEINSVVNDTVGTLLACAYDNENTRIGVILGTGTNCAYIEDDRDGEIINIEWGNFGTVDIDGSGDDNKKESILPRQIIDKIMDGNTPNPGCYYAEKMVSGMYLGELVRLATIEQFGKKLKFIGEKEKENENKENKDNGNGNNKNRFDTPFGFGSVLITTILSIWNDIDIINIIDKYRQIRILLRYHCFIDTSNWTINDFNLFVKICNAITYRSADVSAAMLAAVLEKTGLFYQDRNNINGGLKLCQEYLNNRNKYVTVGIDGSLYHKNFIFRDRLKATLNKLVGDNIYFKIKMVQSEDGSGKGAALAAIDIDKEICAKDVNGQVISKL